MTNLDVRRHFPRALDPLEIGGVFALVCVWVTLHQLIGSPSFTLASVRGAASVLLVTLALPRLPWTPLEALRKSTAVLAVLVLLMGEAGTVVAFAVAPALYGTVLWASAGDDRRHRTELRPHLDPAIGLGAGVVAIGLGLAWAVVAPLAILWAPPTKLPVSAGTALALWLAIPGLVLVACGTAGLAALRRARLGEPG